MQTTQNTSLSLPFPSRWGLSTDFAGRPISRGVLTINSVSDNTVIGTVNFRGISIPINGNWDKKTKQLRLESPYASFSGQLKIYDDVTIRVRHLILSGPLVMKPPSLQAGENGNWIATTNTILSGTPIKTGNLPTVGAFLTSHLLYNTPRTF